MSMKEIRLDFGAVVPSLDSQLFDQGIAMDRDGIRHFQQDADAIVRLSVRGLLPDSERARLNKKLLQRIVKAVEAGRPT